MGPVELLRNKRRLLVKDDEAILLLSLAKGPLRPGQILACAGMPERSFWRAFKTAGRQGWVACERLRTSGKGAGPGRMTLCRLTAEGERMVRALLEEND